MNKQPTPKEISSKPTDNAEAIFANYPQSESFTNSLVQHSTSRDEHPVIDLRKVTVAVEKEDEKQEESNQEAEQSELQEIQLTADVGMDVPR